MMIRMRDCARTNKNCDNGKHTPEEVICCRREAVYAHKRA